MKRSILVDSISFFFVLLFLYTATAKLMDLHSFREELLSSPLLGNFAGFVAWALPILEILLCIALLVPAWRLKGLYATFVLMVLFTGYVISILLIDNQLSCSCGGIVENLTPGQHIVFNSACILLSGVAIWVARKQVLTMRFNWLTSSLSVCLFLLLGWTLFSAFTAPPTMKTGKEGRLLPSFNLLLTDSATYLNTAQIPTGKSFVVIGFSPFCAHCQAETQDIVKNMDKLKTTNFYFVTPYPFNTMKGFYNYYKLGNYPNITMGRDTSNAFMKYFASSSVPYTTVYDPRKRLKQVFNGETNAAKLMKAIVD
jgi:hypothetical protein